MLIIYVSSFYHSHFDFSLKVYTRAFRHYAGHELYKWLLHTSCCDVIQVVFPSVKLIKSISTLGRGTNGAKFISEYKLTVSEGGDSRTHVPTADGGSVFAGNTDKDIPVSHTFTTAVRALLVRLEVVSFSERANLRWSLKGCPAFRT